MVTASSDPTSPALAPLAVVQSPGGLSMQSGTAGDISSGYLAHSQPSRTVCWLRLHKAARGAPNHALSSALRVVQRTQLFLLQVSPSATRRQTRCLLPPPPFFSNKIFPGLPTVPHNAMVFLSHLVTLLWAYFNV